MDIFYPVLMFSNWLVSSLFGLKEGIFAEALNYFIYDMIKIAILLFFIVFFVSTLRTYFSPKKVKQFLKGKNEFYGNILAALFGTITPFCSCSAITLFVGFLEAGIPLGITLSFLISAPLVNEVAAVLLFAMFGFKIAALYVATGLIIAIVAGFILGKLNLEHELDEKILKSRKTDVMEKKYKHFWERISYGFSEAIRLSKTLLPYIALGVAFGAFIHGYAPQNLLQKIGNSVLAVPAAVLIGVPLYSNAAGMVPVVSALIEKGLPIGTALAFMMAVTALSLPEGLILRKVMKKKLLILYFSIVALGIILAGYLFNYLI